MILMGEDLSDNLVVLQCGARNSDCLLACPRCAVVDSRRAWDINDHVGAELVSGVHAFAREEVHMPPYQYRVTFNVVSSGKEYF